MKLPELIVHAVNTDDPTASRPVCLTPALTQDRHKVEAFLERVISTETIMVHEIGAALHPDIRELAYKSKLRFPDLYTAGAKFVSDIGGLEGLAQWVPLAFLLKQATWATERARRRLDIVTNARFIARGDYPADAYLYDEETDSYSNDDGIIDSLYSSEALVAAVGPYPYDSPDEIREAHREAASRWIEANARPYVFPTRQIVWHGVSIDQFREIYEDNPDLTQAQFAALVFDAIGSDLEDNHYEDAYNDLKDASHLQAIAEGWFAARQRDDQIAQANVAPGLEIWNKKQQITSYMGRTKEIVGAFDRSTHDDAIAWAQNALERAITHQQAVTEMWREPLRNYEEAIADWQERGIIIAQSRLDYGQGKWFYRGQRDSNPAGTCELSPEYPTLELCIEALEAHYKPAPIPV